MEGWKSSVEYCTARAVFALISIFLLFPGIFKEKWFLKKKKKHGYFDFSPMKIPFSRVKNPKITLLWYPSSFLLSLAHFPRETIPKNTRLFRFQIARIKIPFSIHLHLLHRGWKWQGSRWSRKEAMVSYKLRILNARFLSMEGGRVFDSISRARRRTAGQKRWSTISGGVLRCGVLYRLKYIDVTTTAETARCRARFIERDSLSSSLEIVHRERVPLVLALDPPCLSDRISAASRHP